METTTKSRLLVRVAFLAGATLAAGVCLGVAAPAASEQVHQPETRGLGQARGGLAQPTADPGRPTAGLGVSGVVESVRTAGGSTDRVEAYGYTMPNAQEAFAWPDGAGGGGTGSGVALLAVPDVRKGSDRTGVNSHFGIANLVPRPGFTDFVFYINNANGLLDYVCQKLNENQTEYVDLRTWGYINPNFEGSGLISASFWEHDLFDDQGDWSRNSVGLAAVADSWAVEPAAGTDGASGFVAPPMFVNNDLPSGRLNGPDCASRPAPRPPPPATGQPRPTPTVRPTTAPQDAPAYAAQAPQVHFPAVGLGTSGLTGDAVITIQNVSGTGVAPVDRGPPAKAVVLLWKAAGACGAECNGPSGYVCTGLIAPGSSWHVGAPDIGTDVRAATVYSFDPTALAAAAPPCADPADCPCDFGALFGTVVSSCNEFESFSRAYSGGGLYNGVSLAAVTGPPLAATIARTGLDPADPTRSMTEAYSGISGPLVGSAAAGESEHLVQLPYVVGPSRTERPASIIQVQNVGHSCATVALWFAGQEQCSARLCASLEMAAGQAARLDLDTCAPEGAVGSAYVVSSQPAAVVVDIESDGTLVSYVGSPRAVQRLDGGPLFGAARDVAFAPLVYASGEPGWTSLLHLQNSGDLEEVFKVTFLGRGGETAVERQYGPICAGASLTVSAADLVPCECCVWIGSARVQAFPASAAPVATPFVGGMATAAPCNSPTQTPGGTPATPTPTPFDFATPTRDTMGSLYLPVAHASK